MKAIRSGLWMVAITESNGYYLLIRAIIEWKGVTVWFIQRIVTVVGGRTELFEEGLLPPGSTAAVTWL